MRCAVVLSRRLHDIAEIYEERNEVLRNLSKGNTERIEDRLKYCGRLKIRISLIGMYCLYAELCPRLSLELDSLSRLASKDECCDFHVARSCFL